MRDGSKMNESIRLKREILKSLYESPNVIELIDSKDVDPDSPDSALYKNIFPYIRIPETQEEVGTFIGIKLNILHPHTENDRFVKMEIKISIICAFDKLQLDNARGTRTEALASEIEEILNWNDTIGFTIHLQAMAEDMINQKYYGCLLTFETTRSNTMKNGVRNYGRVDKAIRGL